MLVRSEAKTSEKFGCKPSERTVEDSLNYGIINLDKPKGPTSHQAVDYLKKILHISKAGHSGTLDPGVTGVLPVALERSTRIISQVLKAGKEYVCVMHLHSEVSEDIIRKAVKEMTGNIKQLPPVKSAVKRQERFRNVYSVNILEIDSKDVLFEISCQAGTYIRKWVHDFGLKVKVNAHMAELRRTKAGPFTEEKLVSLHDLSDNYHFWKEGEDCLKIIPVEDAIPHLKKVYVFDTSIDSLCHGANLNLPGISKLDEDIVKDEEIAIMSLKGELICLGKAVLSSNEMLGSKGLAVNSHTVFMLPGTYPKQ